MNVVEDAVELGWVPEPVVRWGIRRLLRRRLRRGAQKDRSRDLAQLVEQLRDGPIALCAIDANRQHYEVPARFFELVLGPNLKYSSGYWPEGVGTLAEAEEAMLALSAQRAQIEDGMEILDLGCGWGSFTLWLARRYPNARIQAVSNSASQGQYIRGQCRNRGLSNVLTVTADMNDFRPARRFDRVVSIEMFEHMRNYRQLLSNIAQGLNPGGSLFVHIFCHRRLAYAFGDQADSDWMSRHFFRAGLMPSEDLLEHFQDDLKLESRWSIEGEHYARTCRAWNASLYRHREEVRMLFRKVYGLEHADRWWMRWRMFFWACEELFAFDGGRQWGVAHYRFRSP